MTQPTPASRLLIIGLDGGVWSILGSLADLSEMPNLARLRSQGIWSDLISTQPPFTAPAWATFATGVNPGRHGVLNFIHKSPHSPAESLRNVGTPINSSDIHAPTLWDYFQAENKRVGYINVPLSYPLRPVGDFAISGMLTPPHATRWTHPSTLAEELDDYIIDLDYGRPGLPLQLEDFPNPSAMLDQIMQMTERRGFHTLRLMQGRAWDVLMVVFTGTDRIFHHFWHYLQSEQTDEAARLDIIVAEKIRQYFRLLDSILGSLMRSAGTQTNIVIVSDHGFGPAARHWCHLNFWLLELGILHLRMHSEGSILQRLKRQAPWLRDIAKRILPQEARDTLRQHGHLADAVDWSRTRAWAEPLYNNVGGIYLNRSDRFKGGTVQPAFIPELLDHITTAAQQLRIPGQRKPLIHKIQRRDELYHGSYSQHFPDLILTLDPDFAVVPTLGSTLITAIPQLLRSGDHRPEGIFLAHGPHIRTGTLTNPPHLIDMAPTLLHLAGVPIPADMEGRVIGNIWNEDYLLRHLPQTRDPLPPPTTPVDLSEEEATAVKQRLQGLGYL